LTHPRELHRVQQNGMLLQYGFEHNVRIEPIGRFLDFELTKTPQVKKKKIPEILYLCNILIFYTVNYLFRRSAVWKMNVNLKLTRDLILKVNVFLPAWLRIHLTIATVPPSILSVSKFYFYKESFSNLIIFNIPGKQMLNALLKHSCLNFNFLKIGLNFQSLFLQ
jgi:hypothetical protein